MKLIDLIEVIDQNTDVTVYLYDEVATHYNGKDSIDLFYNDYKVTNVWVMNQHDAHNSFNDKIGVEIIDY